MKILIVDDSEIKTDIISLLLAEYEVQAEVEIAFNGKQALERVEEFAPDVIILDLDMPIMNGVEFYESLKAEIPIIINTSFGNEHPLVQKIIELGVSDIYQTGDEPEKLIQMINSKV